MLKYKNISLLIFKSLAIVLIFGSCKTVSYQNSIHTNEDRFYGEEEEEALMLVKFKDFSQHAEDLSGIAQEKVYSKDLYDFALNAEKEHKKFQFNLEILALKKRIKIPDAVSADNQQTYQKIHTISDKKTFDEKYRTEMKKILQTLVDDAEEYLAEGKDKQIRVFITKHTGVFESEIKKINQMQEYEEKKQKEVSMIK